MHQRKKNQNKQNFKTIKKTTLQQINYTQELHIPTFATMQLRHAGRSIQLKKSSSKKPISRKSRCISVKQSGAQAPLNFKQLLKKFKSMRLIQSRSKSPLSSKSKPKSKKSTKKLLNPMPAPAGTNTHSHSQPCSKSNSEHNLTQKLQKTIKKLKQSNYFKDQYEEYSEIPLISTSEAFTYQQKKKLEYVISGDNYEDINIRQLRLFCKNKEPGIKINMDYFRGNIYEIMARRIQRAWRRYQTHKLVQRYASLIFMDHPEPQNAQDSTTNSQHRSNSPPPSNSRSRSQENQQIQQSSLQGIQNKYLTNMNREQIMIQSEQFYHEEMIQRKITYISNLQQELGEQQRENQQDIDSSQENQTQRIEHKKQKDKHKNDKLNREEEQHKQQQIEQLYRLKKEQLQKWSQIIKMMTGNRTEDPQQTQKLLRNLVSKSQKNKRNLQLVGGQRTEQSVSSEQRIGEKIKNRQNPQAPNIQYESCYSNKNGFQNNYNEDPEIALQNLKKKLQQQKQAQIRTQNPQKLSSVSQDSIKQIQQQFNSKKYIQYLDSDMYPIAPIGNIGNPNRSISPTVQIPHTAGSLTQIPNRIPKKKQEALLQKLQSENSSKRILHGTKILASGPNNYDEQLQKEIKSRLSYRSGSQLSQITSNGSIQAEQLKSSRKDSDRIYLGVGRQIKKCISEKSLKGSGTPQPKKNNENIYIKQEQSPQREKLQKTKINQIQKQRLKKDELEQQRQLQSPKTRTQKDPYKTIQFQQRLKKHEEMTGNQPVKPAKPQIKSLQIPQKSSYSSTNGRARDAQIEQDMECIMRREFQYQQIDEEAYNILNQTYNYHDHQNIHNKSEQEANRDKQKAYLEEEFKKHIKQLHKLRDEDSDDQSKQQQCQRIQSNLTDPEYTNKKQKSSSGFNLADSSNESSQIQYQLKQDKQYKQSGENQVEPVLHRTSNSVSTVLQPGASAGSSQSLESSEEEMEDLADKGEAISEMLSNSLALQFLIQMAKYPQSILKSFKSFATAKRSKSKRAPQRPKKNGFQTNQAEIKSFIEELCLYVINEQPHIFRNLEKATGPSALEMLRYMHQSVDNDIYIEEEEDDPTIMILPHWVFENFWTRRVLGIKYDRQGLDQQRQKQRQQYLKGLNKIFLRSCFDCLNECLDYQRNFGPFGKPFPWKHTHMFEHQKSLFETRKSVQNAQKRLFDISSTYCGIIIERDEIASLGGNQQYISQVQQDRLSRMLAQDLVEGEDRWIFYDDEETQLLVETSNTIFYDIIQEVVGQLFPFFLGIN